MGVGGPKAQMKEIAETRAAGHAAAFDALVERIKKEGGVIHKDDNSPLFIDVGPDQFEIGTERIIEFEIRNMEFQLTRKTETSVLQGSGHQKHVEDLDIPRTRDTLKRRDLESGQWQIMDLDLEDMF